MLNKQTLEVPAKTIEQVASVTCDWCKKTYPDAGLMIGEMGIEWLKSKHDGITRNTGVFIEFSKYDRDGGGECEESIYHICPACFGEKLEPWLVSQGVKPNVKRLSF